MHVDAYRMMSLMIKALEQVKGFDSKWEEWITQVEARRTEISNALKWAKQPGKPSWMKTKPIE